MQHESRVVIADTSCFILLDKIGELEILKKIFGEITTTSIIAREFNKRLPDWVEISDAKNPAFQHLIETELDKGEASAIALAMEQKDSLLILDDAKARRYAEKLHLDFTGTLGIFLKAKQRGIIPALKPILDKVQQTNFRFSEIVIQQILHIAGE